VFYEYTGIIFSAIFILGGIALVITLIKYPRDIAKGLFGVLLLPFNAIWDHITFIFFPISLLITFLDDRFKWGFISKLTNTFQNSDYKTSSKEVINFQKFNKYLFINSTEEKTIINELKNASDSCNEVNILDFIISPTNKYTIIELPNLGFYGFNFLVMWLKENLMSFEVFGYASSESLEFFVYLDTAMENNLLGLTNKNKKFWINMYDDLDNQQFLRMNDTLPINKNLTTDFFSPLIKQK